MTTSADRSDIGAAGKRAVAQARESKSRSIATLSFENHLWKREHDLRRFLIGINSEQSSEWQVQGLSDESSLDKSEGESSGDSGTGSSEDNEGDSSDYCERDPSHNSERASSDNSEEESSPK